MAGESTFPSIDQRTRDGNRMRLQRENTPTGCSFSGTLFKSYSGFLVSRAPFGVLNYQTGTIDLNNCTAKGLL